VTLPFASKNRSFFGKEPGGTDRGWQFSQDILYKIVSFLQRQVKVKFTLNECAYDVLYFIPMFHIDYTAIFIPTHEMLGGGSMNTPSTIHYYREGVKKEGLLRQSRL